MERIIDYPVAATLLDPTFDVGAAVERTVREGYCFVPQSVTPEVCYALEAEAGRLELSPNEEEIFNEGTNHQITQSHERSYLPVGHSAIPVASVVADALVRRVRGLSSAYHELGRWQPSEAGYQRYQAGEGHISPHRDSETDELLGITITIAGSAGVNIYDDPPGDPNDYTNLRLSDEFHTKRGSAMLLRAKGLGSGERTIHEALPPSHGSRTVLNLRMRPDIVRSLLTSVG